MVGSSTAEGIATQISPKAMKMKIDSLIYTEVHQSS